VQVLRRLVRPGRGAGLLQAFLALPSAAVVCQEFLGKVSRVPPKEFRAIDDPEIEQRVWRICAQRSVSMGKAVVLLCSLASAWGIVAWLARRTLGVRGWGEWMLLVVGGALVGWFFVAWRHHRAYRLIPGVLRELGHCPRCGYDLRCRSPGKGACPECGTKIEGE
jgi:hypothetical protein